MNVAVNYWAVLVAAVAAFVAGWLYYSPFLLGNAWLKAIGKTTEQLKEQKNLGKMYSISFILSLLTAYIMFHVMTFSEYYFHYSFVSTGISTAIWMWLGFVMPVQATDVLFSEKSWKLFTINTGYQLVSLLVMGITIGLIG
jgi:hypothetical protein